MAWRSSEPRDVRSIVLGITVPESMRLLEPLVERLSDDGWTVMVICGPGSGQHSPLRCGDAEIHVIPMDRSISPASDSVALVAWVRLLRRLRPQVVVGATPKAAMLAMLSSRVTCVPVRILHLWGARWDGYSGTKSRVLRAADRLAASCSTHVISVSESLSQLMDSAKVCKPAPQVLGAGGWPGIDTAVFHPRIVDTDLCDGPTIGFVGRLTADKGIADLLEVHARCRSEVPTLKLHIVGQLDGAQPLSSKQLLALESPEVTWNDWVEDLPSLMSSWDLFVFPTRREGMPNAVLEAAACGLPVVGYSVTGMKDAVIDRATGRLVRPGDVDALAQVVLEGLEADTCATREAARRHVVANFERSHVVGSFVTFLEHLATQDASPGC